MLKNLIVKIFMVVLSVGIIFSACEGPEGPAGANGADGADGANGADGAAGADGTSALVTITEEAAGENCATGGFRIDVGADDNGNGTLEEGEIDATEYTCNGGDGADGKDFLVVSTEEPAGDNCANGGFLIESGLDDNEDGVLDAAEVDNAFYVCNGDDFVNNPRSNLQPLVTTFGAFKTIAASNLINSSEVFTTSTGADFQLAGSADGAGMVEYDANTWAVMVNCEDHYSVARILLDKSDLSVVQADYMLNSSVADFARQCSGTMWESAIHGGTQDFFISSSESFNYQSRRIDILETPDPDNNTDNLAALGEMAWENNTPLPAVAYPGQTVIVGGDDDSGSSRAFGQISMYYSDQGDDDLTGGKIYVLRRVGATEIEDEGDIAFGAPIDVEFIEIENGSSLSFTEMGQACVDSMAFQFMRVEDVDYGKGSVTANQTVYFAVTGRGPGRGTFNDWGTGYKLELDPTNPLQGTMTQILSGNTNTNNRDGNLGALQSPDNICVTENYIYWQEDPNSFSRGHQAYIWQTDLNGNGAVAVLQIDFDPSLEQVDGVRESDVFDGEFGAMFDISDKVGEEGTFILCLQPHYWINEDFVGIDGHDLGIPPGFPGEDWQGSQLVVLRNVPR